LKILHVSNTDLKGGRFTGYSMRQRVDPGLHLVEMAVGRRESDDPHVHELSYRRGSAMAGLDRVARSLSVRLSLDGLPALQGSLLFDLPSFQAADVVHLQLLHASPFFSLASLPRLTRLKPTVWTIHDPWATTGQCAHPGVCEKWLSGCHGHCPRPRGRSPLRARMARPLWLVKRWAYERSNMTLIAASGWMEERVRRSPLLSRFPVHRIPYGVDLERFRPTPTRRQEARTRLGIDPQAHVIAFRALPITLDTHKGCEWLRQALETYAPPRPTVLAAIQDGADFLSLRSKFGVLDLGWLDGRSLDDIYAAADIFVMPSIEEAFGLMAVEAMASGTPVVTFAGTAVPEIIDAPRGGLAVPMKDSKALSDAIGLLLADETLRLRLGRQARALAEERYSDRVCVDRHLRLYVETIGAFARRPPPGLVART
jgi:glycosyltransferase involved in cell wall biosynthesis